MKKCKKSPQSKLNGSVHSLQSFRDLIPHDPRLDVNSATKEQLQTLPGVTHELAEAIVEHRKQIGEFKSINDLVVVPGFGGTKSLNLLRPEIKAVENLRKQSKPISRNPRLSGVVRIAYFPLGDHFTDDYCSNVGVTEVICSFLLRHSIDAVFFTGRHLSDIFSSFGRLVNELNEPNLPRISLTPDRGQWTTMLLPVGVACNSSNQSGATTPSTNHNSETQSLLQSASPSLLSHAPSGASVIYAFNSHSVSLETVSSDLGTVSIKPLDHTKYLILSFTNSKTADLLIGQKLTKGFSDSGAIKVKNELNFGIAQKFEPNPENLRSMLIPTAWDTHQRISPFKPEYLELQMR